MDLRAGQIVVLLVSTLMQLASKSSPSPSACSSSTGSSTADRHFKFWSMDKSTGHRFSGLPCPVTAGHPRRIRNCRFSSIRFPRLSAASVIKGRISLAHPCASQRVTPPSAMLVASSISNLPEGGYWSIGLPSVQTDHLIPVPSHRDLAGSFPSTRAGRCDPDCPIRNCTSFASCSLPPVHLTASIRPHTI